MKNKINDYHKENASFSVFYDEVKDCTLKSKWNKIINKQAFIMNFYRNGYDTYYVVKFIRQTF